MELGGSVVDSSPMYGRSEEVVGDLAAKLGVQSKLFLATKVWTSGKTAGIRQMEDSMRKLRATRIDLMQVHNLVDVDTHLDTLAEWKREGRVRYVGVTHYTAGHHDAVARIIAARPVDFVQINYSVGEREAGEPTPAPGAGARRGGARESSVRRRRSLPPAAQPAASRRGPPRSTARAGRRSS